jgi:hypothetical protein
MAAIPAFCKHNDNTLLSNQQYVGNVVQAEAYLVPSTYQRLREHPHVLATSFNARFIPGGRRIFHSGQPATIIIGP